MAAAITTTTTPATTPASTTFNGGINYGNATLTDPITSAPSNLFSGTGVNGLTDPSWYTAETFTPTDITSQNTNETNLNSAYQNLLNLGGSGTAGSIGAYFSGGGDANNINANMFNDPTQLSTAQQDIATIQDLTPSFSGSSSLNNQASNEIKDLQNQISSAQNANVAGYDATQNTNASDLQYLYQGAQAQNQLLGNLNSRGLLTSYMNGGMGTSDMQSLQNSLDQAQNTNGTSLQTELNNINTQQQSYLDALNNYTNSLGNFQTTQNNNVPGLTQLASTAFSAIPILAGI